MKNLKFKKIMAIFLSFALIFTFSAPAFASGSSDFAIDAEALDVVQYQYVDTEALDVVQYQYVDTEVLDVAQYQYIEPLAIPPVIIAVTVAGIRAALIARNALAANRVIYTYALNRMNQRGFTNEIAASILASGAPFTAANGTRILFSSSQRRAILINNQGNVFNAYNNVDLVQKMTGPSRWVPGW